MIRQRSVLACIAAAAATCISQANVVHASPIITLDQFNFTGDAGSEVSDNASSFATGVTASAITRGPGTNYSAHALADSFASENSATYGTTAALSDAAGEYDTFSLAPTGGNTLSLDNVVYTFVVQNGRNGTGNASADAALEYSLNGSTFSVATQTETYSGSDASPGNYPAQPISATVDLSGISALQGVTGTVYFRIDFFGIHGFDTSGLGYSSGGSQDLVVSGTVVTPTPEPTTLGLAGVGMLGLLARRRRRPARG